VSELFICPWCNNSVRIKDGTGDVVCLHCMDNVALPCPRCWCPGCKIARINDEESSPEKIIPIKETATDRRLGELLQKEATLGNLLAHTRQEVN
jgi:hypothetical protein